VTELPEHRVCRQPTPEEIIRSWNCDCGDVEARVRAQVAEEIAAKIEALKPSARGFWSTADAAHVYAYNDAARIAREIGRSDV
jgi:hypothetical protein